MYTLPRSPCCPLLLPLLLPLPLPLPLRPLPLPPPIGGMGPSQGPVHPFNKSIMKIFCSSLPFTSTSPLGVVKLIDPFSFVCFHINFLHSGSLCFSSSQVLRFPSGSPMTLFTSILNSSAEPSNLRRILRMSSSYSSSSFFASTGSDGGLYTGRRPDPPDAFCRLAQSFRGTGLTHSVRGSSSDRRTVPILIQSSSRQLSRRWVMVMFTQSTSCVTVLSGFLSMSSWLAASNVNM
mmetsp:Transcript_503/g.751  ORF Transcript_503/g.751 Transcript_503/m.751 type:complete len:235 (-) Transcript_503:138-842(-)